MLFNMKIISAYTAKKLINQRLEILRKTVHRDIVNLANLTAFYAVDNTPVKTGFLRASYGFHHIKTRSLFTLTIYNDAFYAGYVHETHRTNRFFLALAFQDARRDLGWLDRTRRR